MIFNVEPKARYPSSDRWRLACQLVVTFVFFVVANAQEQLDRAAIEAQILQAHALQDKESTEQAKAIYESLLAKLQQGEETFRRALALAEKTHNQRQEMQCHLYLGETLFRKNAPDSARAEFQLSLTVSKSVSAKEEQWKALYGLGRIEELLRSSSAAESHYREAISISESTRARLQFSSLRTEFLADKRDVYDSLFRLLLERQDVPAGGAFLRFPYDPSANAWGHAEFD